MRLLFPWILCENMVFDQGRGKVFYVEGPVCVCVCVWGGGGR